MRFLSTKLRFERCISINRCCLERGSRSGVLMVQGYLAKLPSVNRLEGHTRRRLEAQARVIKALAHPTRLFLVEELRLKERCVCNLAEMVGSDVSTVSKHLALLRQAGIVEDEKRGQQVFYRLRRGCAQELTSCASAILEETARRHLEAVVN